MADLEGIISDSLSDAYEDGTVEPDTTDTSTDATDTGTTDTGDGTQADHGTTDGTGAGAEGSPEAKAAAEALKAVEDAFAKEHGINPRDQRRRENRIPYSQVKKIVGNAEKKLAEAVLGQKIAADKPFGEQLKGFATKYTEVEQENQGLRSQLSEVNQVEQIMLNRPEQFLELLPHINPKFAELLGNRGTSAKTTNEPAPVDLPKPDVKIKLPDGSEAATFSPEGLQNYIKALVAQTRDAVLKEVDGKVKPFTDERAAAASQQQILDRLHARVEHARTNWKGFKDWEKDIQAVMLEDRQQAARTRTAPKLDLQDAYITVRDRKHDEELAKLKTDRETQRKEIIDEINKRPRSTAAAGGAARRTTTSDAPKTTEDVIREAIKAAGI